MQFVPGGHVKGALRFDYGRYNEVVSALEVGLKATYFSKKMPVMLLNPLQAQTPFHCNGHSRNEGRPLHAHLAQTAFH